MWGMEVFGAITLYLVPILIIGIAISIISVSYWAIRALKVYINKNQ